MEKTSCEQPPPVDLCVAEPYVADLFGLELAHLGEVEVTIVDPPLAEYDHA
jgi:hypothetical protein